MHLRPKVRRDSISGFVSQHARERHASGLCGFDGLPAWVKQPETVGRSARRIAGEACRKEELC